MAGRMLGEGTRRRDWRRISREAEARGCSIATAAGPSVQVVALDGLATDWRALIEWAFELTVEAVFPEERFEWLRRQTVAELESLADHPEVVTGWQFLKQLYGEHPLGRPIQGTVEGLERLDAEECMRFHRACLGRGPMIAVAGDINPDAVQLALDDLATGDPEAPPEVPCVEEPEAPAVRNGSVALPAGEQAHLFVGGLTVERAAADFEAVQVLGVALGAGSGLLGRLPQRVREDEGLAYSCGIESTAGSGLDRGRLVISLGTAVEELDRARRVVREVLEEVRRDGLTDEEVELARSYLLGREPFGRETARQRALLALESMLWELPVCEVEWTRQRLSSVRREDVSEAARRYLDSSRLVETVGIPR